MTMRIALIVLAVLVALPVMALATLSLLSRRPAGLGAREGRLASCPGSPNCVCSQQDDPAHRIEPLAFTGTAEEAWSSLEDVVGSLPRTKVVERTDGYLRAEASSRLFRFVDDAEFLLDRAARRIHVRSASRAGHSDFGVNRKRIEDIRSRLAGRPGFAS